MGCSITRQCLLACLAFAIASSIVGLSEDVRADTETATIQPDMFYALFFEMDEGVELEFSITSTVAIYVAVLDRTNYDSYSATGDISSSLFITVSPVTSVEETIEAPSTGRYYLIMENSFASSSASVTVEYEFKGTGLELTAFGYLVVFGAIVGVLVFAGVIVLRRRKAKSQVQDPGQQYGGLQDQPPIPPVQPPS